MKWVSAIIVAAGVGKRMNAPIPKQFIKIQGKTILEHTLDKFIGAKFFQEIIVIVSEDYMNFAQTIVAKKEYQTVSIHLGGKERFHSVKNGLQKLNTNCNTVFIHDAVRPFCTPDLLKNCLEASNNFNGLVPTIKMKDSVREIDSNGNSESIDRSKLRSVQTPQVFDYTKLVEAYNVDFSESFTDDASVFEKSGHSIELIDGEIENIKITTPEDLELARIRLS